MDKKTIFVIVLCAIILLTEIIEPFISGKSNEFAIIILGIVKITSIILAIYMISKLANK